MNWSAPGTCIVLLLAGCASPADQAQEEAEAKSGLVGTRWHLSYTTEKFGHNEFDVIFQRHGRLENLQSTDITPDDDTWEPAGGGVMLTFNNHYAVYVGRFVDADHLAGRAKSDVAGTWSWTATRKRR